jgi:hypothetical protein
MGTKKVRGVLVKSEKKAVKMVDKIRRSQRGSRHLEAAVMTAWSCSKTKESGKLELKPTLVMPFLDIEP